MDLSRGLSRHPLDAGQRAGFAGDRGSQLHRVSLVHTLYNLYRSARCGRLELASTSAARICRADPDHDRVAWMWDAFYSLPDQDCSK